MYSIPHHDNLVVPKKILLKIDDKDIRFKGTLNYHGLLLLENSSLIKCSYLAEDERHNLYTIKVYNFENNHSRQNFIKEIHNLQTAAQPFFPNIMEVIPEKEILQVLVIEQFIECLSLKALLEEAQNDDGMVEKLLHGLVLHRLLMDLFDCLFKIEQRGDYHGFINLSNICVKPSFQLEANFSMKAYLETMLQGLFLTIWDHEAHKYWEIVSLEPSIKENSSLWKSILTKNGMIEAPEFDIEEHGLLKLSIKYDVWMIGVILLQIVSFSNQRKAELLQEYSATLPRMNFQERAIVLKEFIEDPLLYELALLLFQDIEHRPLPSELIKLDIVIQIKRLLGIKSVISGINDENVSLSYEVLLAGLSCTNREVALNALDILLDEASKEKEVFWRIIDNDAYLQIINILKTIQKNDNSDQQTRLMERGIKFLIKVLEHGGRKVINGFKASGIISLILRAIENDFDQNTLCQLFQYLGCGSTETFIHFVEKSGFINKITTLLKQDRNNKNSILQHFYLKTSHFCKLATLLEQSELLSEEELFLQLSKVSLVKRTDLVSLKIIKKLLTHYGKIFLSQPLRDNLALKSYFDSLFSWLLLRNIVIYASCHSQCIAAVLPDGMKVPYENGFYCKTCSQSSNIDVFLCVKCTSHCHVGHVISALGYQYFTCSCNLMKNCKRRQPEPVPPYLLNQNENYLDSLKISFNKIPKNFKSEIGKNIFLNNNGEIGTIISSIPLCSITSNHNYNPNQVEKTIGYYEVEIKLGGFYDQNAVGFTSDYLYPKDEYAGYLENSIAYHGDDGTVYLNGDVVAQLSSFGSYDIIGCGITNFGTVYFIHNGILLAEIQTEFIGPIFPLVSLRGRYSSVQVNFEGNFMFNYEDLKDQIDQKEYIKFISPLVLDGIFVQTEWLDILKQLNQANQYEWLNSIVKTITDRKEKPQQQNKENDIQEIGQKEQKIIDEKSSDVLKELQSVNIMLREGKRSVKEFTSTRDYEVMRSLVQESHTTDGNIRNMSPKKENLSYNNSKSLTGLQLRETHLNEHLTPPVNSEKYLAPIEGKPQERKTRKSGLCHCNSKKGSKKGCELF